MNLKLSFLSLLSLILLASCRPPSRSLSSFDSAINRVSAPYRNVIGAAKNNVNSNFQALKSLFNSQPNEPQAKPEQALIIYTLNNGADQAPEDDGANERMLQDPSEQCQNGFFQDTLVRIYMCGSRIVSKAQYEAVGGKGCATPIEGIRKMCYCPYEFYGDFCENLNTWSCNLSRLNYLEDCEGPDSFDYVYSMDGVPPCYRVNAGDSISLLTNLSCETTNSQYNFEGVKPAAIEVVKQPVVKANPFTYLIDTNTTKLTFIPDIKQEVAFTTWDKLSEPYVIKTNITLAQLAGNESIASVINFVAPLTDYAAYGRYYYEMTLTFDNMDGLNFAVANQYYYGGYFEQAGYKEPKAPSTVNKPLAIGLSIFAAILLIGLFVGYRRIKNKRQRRSFQARAETMYAVVEDRQ